MDYIKEILATRGGQLLARYAAKGLVAIGVYLHTAPSVDGFAHTSEEIASFAVALILIGVDHLSHYWQKDAA